MRRKPPRFVRSNEAYVSTYAFHVWRGPFYIVCGARERFRVLSGLAAFAAENMRPRGNQRLHFFPVDTRSREVAHSADKGFAAIPRNRSRPLHINVEIMHD